MTKQPGFVHSAKISRKRRQQRLVDVEKEDEMSNALVACSPSARPGLVACMDVVTTIFLAIHREDIDLGNELISLAPHHLQVKL